MKKIIALILTLIIVLSFAGCGGSNANNTGNDIDSNIQTNDINNEQVKDTTGTACTHSWSPATCTEAAKCTICGEYGGSALGHKYGTATCTAPAKCTACGATNGSVAGHKWEGATCQSPKKCTVCGATEGKASSCADSGSGNCKYCGKDVVLSSLERNVKATLFVPTNGAMNYYATIKISNSSQYNIEMTRHFYCNGKGCVGNIEQGDILNSGYEITISAYRALIASQRYDDKYKDMYLDNNSTAYTFIKVNGKTICMKFDVNGNTQFAYDFRDLGIS